MASTKWGNAKRQVELNKRGLLTGMAHRERVMPYNMLKQMILSSYDESIKFKASNSSGLRRSELPLRC